MIGKVEEIKARLMVDDALARAGVTIKRRHGRRIVGLCPIHQEKTPSFTIYADQWSAHCFGCGWHGDMLDLLAAVHRKSNSEIIRELASEFGLNNQPRKGRTSTPPAPFTMKVSETERTAEFATLARVRREMVAALDTIMNEGCFDREDIAFALKNIDEADRLLDRWAAMTTYDFGTVWRTGQIVFLWEAMHHELARQTS